MGAFVIPVGDPRTGQSVLHLHGRYIGRVYKVGCADTKEAGNEFLLLFPLRP